MESVDERHRHRYEVNPKFVSALEEKGMVFVGHDVNNERMEIMELPGMFQTRAALHVLSMITCADHPYFVGVQYHPEFLTRPLKPSPPFLGSNHLIVRCKRKALCPESSLWLSNPLCSCDRPHRLHPGRRGQVGQILEG